MRFIVDECTGPSVAAWLREEGHDVFSVYDSARGSDDVMILNMALRENRVLITNDRDFGEMIFRLNMPHCGIVFLRLADNRSSSKIHILEKLLAGHQDIIEGNFITITEKKIRISRA